MPASTIGSAAGSTTVSSVRARPWPKVRAMSSSTGSVPRTPCTVLTSTGKNTPRPMIVSFIDVSMPRNRISGGSSAGLGSGRSTSTSGSSSPCTQAKRPISSPTATAAAHAAA